MVKKMSCVDGKENVMFWW